MVKVNRIRFNENSVSVFSPLSILARFHHDTGKEEQKADEFAIKVQGTSRYINSAKKKITSF